MLCFILNGNQTQNTQKRITGEMLYISHTDNQSTPYIYYSTYIMLLLFLQCGPVLQHCGRSWTEVQEPPIFTKSHQHAAVLSELFN